MIKNPFARHTSDETVNPPEPTRLSRRNILTLVLSIAGVVMVLFFSSRRKGAPMTGDYEDYDMSTTGLIELVPLEPKEPTTSPWAMPEASAPTRAKAPDDRQRQYDEARQSRGMIHVQRPSPQTDNADAPPAKPSHIIREGSVIAAALETGLDTGRPGPVLARVTRPVRDSQDLQTVLIPAGTKLIGTQQQTLEGTSPRVVVAWNRMITPDGEAIDLPGLPAMEHTGEGGLQDEVKHFRAHRFGTATLLAILGGSTALASSAASGTLAGAALAMELSRAGSAQLGQRRSRKPVVVLRPGYRFLVYVSGDIAFDER